MIEEVGDVYCEPIGGDCDFGREMEFIVVFVLASSFIHSIIIVQDIKIGGVSMDSKDLTVKEMKEIEKMVGSLYDTAHRDATAERLQAMIGADENAGAIASAAVEELRYRGEVRYEVVDGLEGEDTCGCGDPIVRYNDEWFHVYNPALTGTDDHDARP
ncbi:hypothetical protein ACFY4C_40095 [Actinomadura viridis]|uniref:hypothetical protein n=1 Tax=Actinomadura viridis TaxID=58110 RepID=UPI003697FD48